MEFNDVFKFASIRSAIYNVNLRSEQRPKRPIPHFTQSTYILLEHLRSKKPQIVNGIIIKRIPRLRKENGTYFTDQEEEECYYELDKLYDDWNREQEKEREYREADEEREYREEIDMIRDTWRFSK